MGDRVLFNGRFRDIVELEKQRRQALSSGDSSVYNTLNDLLGHEPEDDTLNGIGAANNIFMEASTPRRETKKTHREPSLVYRDPRDADYPCSKTFRDYFERR